MNGLPPPLPVALQPCCNWPALKKKDALRIWQHYENFLLQHSYYIMGTKMYNTLGSGDTNIPPPAADPFHPNDTETFIRYYDPEDLLFTRTLLDWQPGVNICVGIDDFQRQIVFKALTHQSTELKVLRLTSERISTIALYQSSNFWKRTISLLS
ncbi:hypothetical protein M422DRAFT_251852 [Sphaerobolus stellatus SS14]|uniref:Uncharacterized protein n=1 Tax=Sphaerobolus stellatus (strain SS14) TaxID=990650 RepID=A0A0C9UPM8_SPHS4|nr:hypothetical protein M422DRAFT_251852 [Sphaerobolus stellatus SS14]